MSRPLGRLLSSGPLNAAGVVSYGVLLWHWPLIQPLQDTTWCYGLNDAGQLLVVLAGTLGLAAASWFVMEQPSPRPKDRGSGTRQRPTPAGAGPATVTASEPIPAAAPA